MQSAKWSVDLWRLGQAAMQANEGDLVRDRSGRLYQVQCFNRTRGFGFLRRQGTNEKVFVHLPTLRSVRQRALRKVARH